jgi:hypothetical protein
MGSEMVLGNGSSGGGLARAFFLLARGIGGTGLYLLLTSLIQSVSSSSHEYSFHTSKPQLKNMTHYHKHSIAT